jgi:hypothetical protein
LYEEVLGVLGLGGLGPAKRCSCQACGLGSFLGLGKLGEVRYEIGRRRGVGRGPCLLDREDTLFLGNLLGRRRLDQGLRWGLDWCLWGRGCSKWGSPTTELLLVVLTALDLCSFLVVPGLAIACPLRIVGVLSSQTKKVLTSLRSQVLLAHVVGERIVVLLALEIVLVDGILDACTCYGQLSQCGESLQELILGAREGTEDRLVVDDSGLYWLWHGCLLVAVGLGHLPEDGIQVG